MTGPALKRVAIMGSGGVGGYFGARLAQKGVDVTFIARGAHLDAMQRSGLHIDDQGDEFLVHPVQAVEDTSGAAPVDVILFTVKMGDAEGALKLCRPLMHDQTFIVTFQNGVESVGLVEDIVGAGRVLGGAAYVVANIAEPGLIRKIAPIARLEFAEPDGTRSDRAVALYDLLQGAGIDAHLMDDLQELLWRKFALLSASGAMTALTRQPMAYMQEDPLAREIMIAALDEMLAVAKARGVRLAPDIRENTITALSQLLQGDSKSSQLVDLERGKPLELHWLSGAIHRFGREYGVPTPIHSTVCVALKPFADGQG